MPHAMILGPTGCGKTTLAKQMVNRAAGSGVPVLILDPTPTQWDHADFRTKNTDEFIEYVFINNRCLLIIDEAAEAIGRALSKEDRNRIKLATQTRHLGHNAVFISQDATTVSATIRRQCQELWCFRQSYQSVKMLASEFCNPAIMAATDLKRGECLHADLYGEVSQFCVFELDKTPGKREIKRTKIAC